LGEGQKARLKRGDSKRDFYTPHETYTNNKDLLKNAHKSDLHKRDVGRSCRREALRYGREDAAEAR